MPSYRLVTDHGTPAAVFDAPDDTTAEAEARVMAHQAPSTKRTGYRLERHDDTWVTVTAWMPQALHQAPGGLDTLVAPAPGRRLQDEPLQQ